MTAHDPKLVETVARVLDPEAWGFGDKMQLERDRCDETLLQARAALDAINASGTHVITELSSSQLGPQIQEAIRAAVQQERTKCAEIARRDGWIGVAVAIEQQEESR